MFADMANAKEYCREKRGKPYADTIDVPTAGILDARARANCKENSRLTSQPRRNFCVVLAQRDFEDELMNAQQKIAGDAVMHPPEHATPVQNAERARPL
jgi:hypothetical protein